ncbi:HEAT repeat domain-containing protein [Dactylosporangium cerinum]
MTAASALITVVEPAFWSVFGLLFFGFGLVLAEATRRQRLDDVTRNRLEPFLGRLRRGDVDGYGWLLKVLATIDGRTPRARRRSRVALAAITADERLLDGLIWHCRHRQISVAVFAERLGRPGAAGLTPVLASLHPDGHVRQAAVTAMGRRPLRPAHLPFLLERANDWVPEVRAAAHEVLRSQLGQHPGLLAPARMAFERVARRRHAPTLRDLIYG